METVPALVPNFHNHPDNGNPEAFPPILAKCPKDCYFLAIAIREGQIKHECLMADVLDPQGGIIAGAKAVLSGRMQFNSPLRSPGFGIECPVDIDYDGERVTIPNRSEPDNGLIIEEP